MNLVSFDDYREQYALFRIMSSLPQQIHWTGYNDFRAHRHWESDQGMTPNFQIGFRAGEPNNAGGTERCIHMYKYDDGAVNLNDHDCETQFRVVCQSSRAVVRTTTPAATTTTTTEAPIVYTTVKPKEY